MDTFDAEGGRYRVVSATELEDWTIDGWVLVSSYEEDVVLELRSVDPPSEAAVERHKQSGYRGRPEGQGRMTQALAKARRFVIQKNAESTLHEVSQLAKWHEREAQKLAGLLTTANGELAECREREQYLADELDAARKKLDAARDGHNTSRERLRQLLADMQKVRHAVGDVAWKNALATGEVESDG